MQHKASMRDKRGDKPHYHCHVCGEDFKTEYAEIKHIQQVSLLPACPFSSDY